ncbi:MAG: hypothetical protein AAGE89_04720 [Pseudomonadota bacterium]
MFFSIFHKILFGGIGLILSLIVAYDVYALLAFKPVEARIVSISETCTIKDDIFSDCAEARRAAIATGRYVKREAVYEVVFTRDDGTSERLTIEGETSTMAEYGIGVGETLPMRLNPATGLPEVTRPVFSIVIALIIPVFVIWWCFLPINQGSLFGMTPLRLMFVAPDAMKRGLGRVMLAQLFWRSGFFALWIALLGVSAVLHDQGQKPRLQAVSGTVERVEERCVVKWWELKFIGVKSKDTGRVPCLLAELRLKTLNNFTATLKIDNRYLVAFAHPNGSERVVILREKDVANGPKRTGETIGRMVHTGLLDEVMTAERADGTRGIPLIAGGIGAAFVLMGLSLLMFFGGRGANPAPVPQGYAPSRKTEHPTTRTKNPIWGKDRNEDQAQKGFRESPMKSDKPGFGQRAERRPAVQNRLDRQTGRR